jgi:hypothetical protein
MAKEPEILCPKCEYRPKPEDRWSCIPSCGTSWHTFWTAGVCPGCGTQWHKTQCPSCGTVSPHKDWYRFPEESDESEQESVEKDQKEKLPA